VPANAHRDKAGALSWFPRGPGGYRNQCAWLDFALDLNFRVSCKPGRLATAIFLRMLLELSAGDRVRRRRRAWHRSRPASASPEIGNAYCLFQDHPGIIVGIGPGRLTVVQNARVRPIGYARATLTALLIAHDVSPLCAVHVAMAIGERRVGGIGVSIVSRT